MAGLKTIIDQIAAANPKAKSAKPEDFIDARLVEEFDKSGYQERIYGHSLRRQEVAIELGSSVIAGTL